MASKKSKVVKTVEYRISNCMECPWHEVISDPGSEDSFDAMDISVKCIQTGKYVVVSERPWRAEDEPIPAWCPLG